MKTRFVSKTVILILLCLGLSIATSQTQDSLVISNRDRAVPGRVVVQFREGVIALQPGQIRSPITSSVVRSSFVLGACRSFNATEIEKVFPSAIPGQTQIVSPITGRLATITDMSQFFYVKFPAVVSVSSAVAALANAADILRVHGDSYPVLDAIPDDPLFGQQWHLNNMVNPKFDIRIKAAWDHAKGDGIKIAIIDGGVRHDIPDMNAHIWFGAGSEIGYDTTTFEGRHGTYVAGTAAAVTNNGINTAGVAWNGLIMPRIGYTVTDFASDIYDAALNGASVINNSWHTHDGDPSLPTLLNAVTNAYNLGATIFGSMGNDYPPAHNSYPAGFDGLVQAVGSLTWINNGDTTWASDWQNRMPYIDVTAPGEHVMTTSPLSNTNTGYPYVSWVGGTSFSTPQAAGLAALIRSANPDLTNAQVMDIMKRTAVLFSGWEADPNTYGAGMLDCYQSILLSFGYAGKSVDASATFGNHQRKLVRESSGKLHVAFGSGGSVFYRNSNKTGASWQTTNRISDGTSDNTYPSITERSNYIYAVWQRQNGSNWDLLYNYSTNGGTTWLASPIILVSNFGCSAPGPQPVILAGTPSASFELMVVYRHLNGLSSLRSTSYPVGGNWTGPVLVTGTNQYSQNPSLTYRSNDYPPYRLVWDENNKINYSMYYPDTWTTPYDIGNGAYMASNKTNPSISVTSSNDIDIVWEGTYSGTRSIITNRNLSSVYNAFQNSSYHYYKPSVTGHVNGRATVVWHDNSLNVRKAIYDPAYGWYYIGSIIGTNGANASASVMNQQGGDAKVVWTEGTSSPYTIHLDGTLLNKPIAKGGSENSTLTLLDGKVHRQLILRDSVTNAFLAVQLEAPRLVGSSGEESVEFIAVDDTMRYTPQQIFSLLETKPFALTSRTNAFAMRRMIRAQGIGTLASQGRLRVELVNAQNGQVISSFAHFDLVENGRGIALDDSIRVPVNRSSGQYKLRLKAENLALSVPTRRASLVNIFVGQSEGQRISKPNEVIPTSSALLGNYPNPFNPATTIRFAIPQNEYVTLKVYDMLGREVATLVNGVRDAGTYDEVFDASKLSSGVYIYKLTAGNFTAAKKLAVVK